MKPLHEGAQASGSIELQGFTIIREAPDIFSGDWPQLKGKQTLYIWAKPEGSVPNAAGSKLHFAENIFRERSREAVHNSQSSVGGIVVIFLDQPAGVAAATLEDIAHWTDGTLTLAAFLKKCSLDPPCAHSKRRAPKTKRPFNNEIGFAFLCVPCGNGI
jgi:hypothetical protein